MAQQSYVTQADVKAYLGIPDSNTASDQFIQIIIPKVMAYIDKYTGRTFGWGTPDNLADFTNYKNIVDDAATVNGEIHDGLYGTQIWLRNMDIASIDEIKIGNPNVGTPTILNTAQYLVRNDGRLILGGNWFDSTGFPNGSSTQSVYGLVAGGYQTIAVKYHYGYAGVPEDIAMAALDLCQALNVARKANGIMRERLGDYQIDYDANLRGALARQKDTMGVLKGYRMVRL
jgi:hypothetical protein